MKYEAVDMGSFTAHFIRTDRFKTLTFRVCLRDEIKKEEITLRNLFIDVLMYSCEKYKTRRELVLHSQELYAVSCHANAMRNGRYSTINCFLSVLNEKYTEPGMLRKSLDLFHQILFHPNVENKEFVGEAFPIMKKNNEMAIRGIKEDTAKYSLIRLLEEMDPNQPYAYHGYGNLEDLEKITPADLYQYYLKVMNHSLVDIYILGDYDLDEMKGLVREYFPFQTFKRPKVAPIIEHDRYRSRIRTVVEHEPIEQSKLSIGCKIETLSEFERNYALTLYNLILGGTGDSKFFQNIREKYSVAYYVNSSANKLDHLLLIRAGISKENFKSVMKHIKKEMKDMVLGNFTDESIEKAKMTYITSLKEVEDSPTAMIETYLAKDLLHIGDLEERKIEIQKVTREDIMTVAKKIKMDTVYLLEGEDANEGN